VKIIGCLLAMFSALAAAPALADESLLDSLARAGGLIAPTPDPPDFVKASRSKTEPAEIPVFAAPPEPPSKVKSPAGLKAMDADLAQASRSQGPKRADGKSRR
jgi:hypothetical protein